MRVQEELLEAESPEVDRSVPGMCAGAEALLAGDGRSRGPGLRPAGGRELALELIRLLPVARHGDVAGDIERQVEQRPVVRAGAEAARELRVVRDVVGPGQL